MKLTELINQLQRIQNKTGDLVEVYISYCVGPDLCDYDSSTDLSIELDDDQDVRIVVDPS